MTISPFVAAILVVSVIALVAYVITLRFRCGEWLDIAYSRQCKVNDLQMDNRRAFTDLKTLQIRYNALKGDCESLDLSYRQKVQAQQSTITSLQAELKERHQLSGLSFYAMVPTFGWVKTKFSLGIGPCGKEVVSLQLIEKEDRYVIIQRCTDGERKHFDYMKKDVDGRIERAFNGAQMD